MCVRVWGGGVVGGVSSFFTPMNLHANFISFLG